MNKTFTSSDSLLQYLYRETNAQQNFETEQQLRSNVLLRNEFTMLRDAAHALPNVKFNPSDSSLSRILEYSRMHKELVS
jgi:hypothetical protein